MIEEREMTMMNAVADILNKRLGPLRDSIVALQAQLDGVKTEIREPVVNVAPTPIKVVNEVQPTDILNHVDLVPLVEMLKGVMDRQNEILARLAAGQAKQGEAMLQLVQALTELEFTVQASPVKVIPAVNQPPKSLRLEDDGKGIKRIFAEY